MCKAVQLMQTCRWYGHDPGKFRGWRLAWRRTPQLLEHNANGSSSLRQAPNCTGFVCSSHSEANPHLGTLKKKRNGHNCSCAFTPIFLGLRQD